VGLCAGSPEPQGTYIDTSISADTKVWVVINDSLGTPVRALVNGEYRTEGFYADYWDCRDDSGFVVHDGLYYAVLGYELGGVRHELDLTHTTGGTRHEFPFGIACDTRDSFRPAFSPFDDDLLELSFRLCRAQEVTAFIGPQIAGSDETRTRTLVNRRAFPEGQSTIYWDGLDDQGEIAQAPLGDVLITGFWRYDLPDNAMLMTGGTPQITDVRAEDNYFSPLSEKCDRQGRAEGVTLSFCLSEDVQYAEVRVYSIFTSTLVRTIRLNDLLAGEHSVFWDGKNNNGEFVDIGDYRLGVAGRDVDGNESMLRYALVRLDY
jgi:flagellar hook assembly protein FlgD